MKEIGPALNRQSMDDLNKNFDETEKNFKNQQSQIDKLVADGDSSPQAAAASVGLDGTKHGSLKSRLDAEEQKTVSQLAQTRNKGVPIGLNDADSDLLNAIQGGSGTPINVLSIPRNKSVDPFKTTFIGYGKNIANAQLQVKDTAMDGAGNSFTQLGWYLLTIIDVKPNTVYTASRTLRWESFSDSGFINGTGFTQASSFRTGSGATRLRVSFASNTMDFSAVMIVEGATLPTEFVPFQYKALDGNNFYSQETKTEVRKDISDQINNTSKIPTTENVNVNKVISAYPDLVEFGNYNNPFTNDEKSIAKQENFGGELPYFVPIYKGKGVQALGYSAYQGFEVAIEKKLTEFNASSGDLITIIFYLKHNLKAKYDTSLTIGGSKVDVTSGEGFSSRLLKNGYTEFKKTYKLNESEVSNGSISKLVVSFYSADSDRENQYMNISAPLIYLNEQNIYGLIQMLTIMRERPGDEKKGLRWTDKRAYFCGDSITENRLYQNPLSKLIELGSYTTDGNPGQAISGCTSKIIADPSRLDGHDLLTIFAGTNDFGGNKDLGSMDSPADSTTTYGSIKQVIAVICSAKPDLKLVLITPLPRGKFGNQPDYGATNGRGKTITDYVNAVREVGSFYHIPVLNLYDLIGWNQFNIATKTGDNLHPNTKGNLDMVPIMASFLNSL